MPILDRSALEDTSGMDFLAAALGTRRLEPAAPAGASMQATLSPERFGSGRRTGTSASLCAPSAVALPSSVPARLRAPLPQGEAL